MNKRKSVCNSDEPEYNYNLLDNLSKKKYKQDDKWISGTSVANYLNGEPFLDWLNLYYDKYGFNNMRITRSFTKKFKQTNQSKFNRINQFNPSNTLMSNGLKFEQKVYDYLQKTYQNQFINIIPNNKYNFERDYLKLNNITTELIKKGVPIIAQAVLVNKPTRMRGIADLLIRSDHVNKIFKRPILKSNEIKYKNKPYYIVVDIKWTSMTLCADGETIRNEGRYKSYKGQLLIYNYMLGKTQNYTPPFSFILAKNWKIDRKNDPQEGYSCFDLMGRINYHDRDNLYIKKTVDAINWLHLVRKDGLNYSPFNPSIKEMCVNASNQNDHPWTEVKKELIKKTRDITAIWNITNNHRDVVFDNGIKRWDQNNCTSETLGLNDGKKATVIDKILSINRQNDIKILPNKLKDIKDNRCNWKKKYPTDFYIDFETLSLQLGEHDINIFNSQNESQIIFMIGIGYEHDDEFKYKVFKMNELTLIEEKRILTEFKNYIDLKTEELDPDDNYYPRFFHWSHAEQTMLENAFNRHPSLLKMWNNHIDWVDLCDIFTSEPIVVKGALSFKLKEIGNAMFSNGLINTHWDNGQLSDGLSAMTAGIQYYQKENKSENDENTFNSIIKYNQIDCKILWDITNFIRGLN